jgi:hypothetical protein
VNVNTDPANCGSCSNVCPKPANATAACAQGQCGLGACDPNYADCNRDPNDGCEANLQDDHLNCGACGTQCSGNTPSCSNGSCVAGCSGTFIANFGSQNFYKVQVTGTMSDTNVFNACINAGCHVPCDAQNGCQYNDNTCVLGTANDCDNPMSPLSQAICSGAEPPYCAPLLGVYQYMGQSWQSGSSCGAEPSNWCVVGNGMSNRWALCID